MEDKNLIKEQGEMIDNLIAELKLANAKVVHLNALVHRQQAELGGKVPVMTAEQVFGEGA